MYFVPGLLFVFMYSRASCAGVAVGAWSAAETLWNISTDTPFRVEDFTRRLWCIFHFVEFCGEV